MTAAGASCFSFRRTAPDSPRSCRLHKKAGAHVNYDDHMYHREREQHCRSLAQTASDPDVRRRHEELADLHASRAAQYDGITEVSGGAESAAN